MFGLLTPNRGSRSGSLLARSMGIPKLSGKRLEGLVPSKEHVVINWGNSDPPAKVLECTVINDPTAVRKAVNKLNAFQAFSDFGVMAPAFTRDMRTARSWVSAGHKVVARHNLAGSGGDGIQILSSVEDFPCEAPLYVLYIPKKSEWRFHIFHDEVFDFQRKMRRRDIPDDKVNWQIRNHANGFIFGRDQGDDPVAWGQLKQVAQRAVKALGLDFGAVDIIYNEKQKRAYALEVNTAPGLEGATVDSYCQVFSDYFEGIREGKNQKQKSSFNQLASSNDVDFEMVLKNFARFGLKMPNG